MKRISIIAGLAVILLLISMIYKERTQSVWMDFPKEKQPLLHKRADFIVYFFFSYRDCVTCLEIIDNLNRLNDEINIIGILPDEEEKEVDFIRKEFGIRFEMRSARRYHKYSPASSPSLIGVDEKGRIKFLIPSVPGFKYSIDSLLESFIKPK